MNLRPYRIQVSKSVFEALEVLAELEGASCLDEVADLRLALMLSNEAELKWAIAERKKFREAFRKDYRERIAAKRATPETPKPVLRNPEPDLPKAHMGAGT